jgi:hypothetical protein
VEEKCAGYRRLFTKIGFVSFLIHQYRQRMMNELVVTGSFIIVPGWFVIGCN